MHGGFTPDKYNQVIKQLDAAGAGGPKGRTLHVSLEYIGLERWPARDRTQLQALSPSNEQDRGAFRRSGRIASERFLAPVAESLQRQVEGRSEHIGR